jgi:hypothetical protein
LEVKKQNIPPPLDNTLNIDTFEDIRYKNTKKQMAYKLSPKLDESFAAMLFPYKDASEYYLTSPKSNKSKGKLLEPGFLDYFRNIELFLDSQQDGKEVINQYKSSCLKSKHIVAENGALKVGCQTGLSGGGSESLNALRISIFVKNKTSRPLQPFTLNFYDLEGKI